MKRLIVNADDLGYDAAVNDRIFRLMGAGNVTSATILMNAPAAEAAAGRLRELPQVSFGVHLNITEFPPLTRGAALEPLCDANGNLATAWVKTLKPTRATREAVFHEWCAQVQRALDCGVPVSHFDSHHHIHNIPRLFPVLKRVQLRFGIRKVRMARNIFDIGERLRFGRRQAIAAWNLGLKTIVPTRTTDAFTDFSTFHKRVAAGLPWEGTIELMCHPGSHLYEDETLMLEGDWRTTVALGAALISYRDL